VSLSRFINYRSGFPLKGVPNRKAIGKRVSQGRAVEDLSDGVVAIAYALWVTRVYGVGAYVFAVGGLLNIVPGVVSGNWVNLGLGMLLLGMGVLYFWLRARARRSVVLNRAIAL